MRKSIKILQVVSGDLWAGAENMFFNLCVGLDEVAQNEITIVLLNNGELEKNLIKSGFSVIILDENKLTFFQLVRQLLSLTKKLRPDVIHTHRRKENILGAIVAKLSGVASIRTTHGSNENEKSRLPWYKKITYYIDWFAGMYIQNKIVAVSSALQQELESEYRAGKIALINNGINTEYIEKKSHESNPVKKNKDNIYVGMIGRLAPVKRVDFFITIASELISNGNQNYHFFIVGDGPLHETIKILIKDMNLENYITMTGHVSNALPYLQSLDVLLLLSDHEGMPMIVLEAMSLAVPVISHNIGSISQLLDNGQYGTLVDSQKASEYVSVLSNYAKHREVFLEKALHGREQVKNNYSHTVMARNYLKIYTDVCK